MNGGPEAPEGPLAPLLQGRSGRTLAGILCLEEERYTDSTAMLTKTTVIMHYCPHSHFAVWLLLIFIFRTKLNLTIDHMITENVLKKMMCLLIVNLRAQAWP